MKVEGTVSINAPRAKTWEFLTDPESVCQCAPGLKSVEVIVPDQKFKVVASIGFGAVGATFHNDVEFLELIEPERAVVKVHGTAPGSAVDVTAVMDLAENAAGGTDLIWSADIMISGSIASLATRMMGGMSKKLTGIFFECVKSKIEG